MLSIFQRIPSMAAEVLTLRRKIFVESYFSTLHRVSSLIQNHRTNQYWDFGIILGNPLILLRVWKSNLSVQDRFILGISVALFGFCIIILSIVLFFVVRTVLAYVFWWPTIVFVYPSLYFKLPDILGCLLTWILSKKVLYHPLEFGRIFLLPSYSNGMVCLRVVVENFGFGNPPNFPHKNFIQAKSVLVTLSCHYRHLLNVHGFFLPKRYHNIKPLLSASNKNHRYMMEEEKKSKRQSLNLEEDEDEEELALESGKQNHFAISLKKVSHWGASLFKSRPNKKHAGTQGRASGSRWNWEVQRSGASEGSAKGSETGCTTWIDTPEGGADGDLELRIPDPSTGEVTVRRFSFEDLAVIVKVQRILRRARLRENLLNLIQGRWGVVYVERLEFNEVLLNFELSNGMLNIKGFSKDLALGELRKQGRLKEGESLPNCLKVKIIRCRNLKAMDFKIQGGSSDPYVRVKARSEEYVTQTHMKILNPMFNEEFKLHCSDPSTVLHISVWDEDVGLDDFLGQWLTTVKYLKDRPVTRQWVKLRKKNFEWGGCGELEMEASWEYVEGFDVGYVEPKLTALQQLQENSDETTLRLGSATKVVNMLKRFPYLFDVELVVFRNIQFFMKDLFAGYEGTMEGHSWQMSGAKKMDRGKVTVAHLQLTNRDKYKLSKGRQGHTLYGFLNKLFKGTVPQVANMVIAVKGVNAIAQGLMTNIHNSLLKNFNLGQMLAIKPKNSATVPSRRASVESTATMPIILEEPVLSAGTGDGQCARAHSHHSQSSQKTRSSNRDQIYRQVVHFFGKKKGSTIEADDEDFLKPASLSSVVEVYKTRGKFLAKPRILQQKGSSVYYSTCEGSKEQWNRRLPLECCSSVSLKPSSLTHSAMLQLTFSPPPHAGKRSKEYMLLICCPHSFLEKWSKATNSMKLTNPKRIRRKGFVLKKEEDEDEELLKIWLTSLQECIEATKACQNDAGIAK